MIRCLWNRLRLWWQYVWPWSASRTRQSRQAKEVERRFQEQLREAQQRQFNLQAAVQNVREQRKKQADQLS